MLKIYKASAGSGKTHTLTKDFLFLLFENQLKYKNILAVTFTNKAAGEMKNRIVNELSKLSENTENSAFYNDLNKKFNLSSDTIKNNAKIILKKILHNYTFFNISTIDSFVQKIIRSFTFELKLSSNYKIELDNEKVTTDITDILLSELSDNLNLQKWLKDFAFYRVGKGKTWNFRYNIIDFAKQFFDEKFYGFFNENLYDDDEFNKKITDLRIKTSETITFFEHEVTKIAKNAVEIIESSKIYDLSIRNIKYLCDFFYKNIENIDLEMNNTLVNAVNANNFWNKNTKDIVKNQWNSTLNKLTFLINDIITLKEKYFIKYQTAILIENNIYSLGVINSLKNVLNSYRQDNNLMLIIDLTILLKKIIGNNEAPFIYEKIGNRFSNIMIDEFQDTSEFQWLNFKPLINNSLSTNNYNLIVGDVKQSIYRWRNGDWKLLHSGVKQDIVNNFINETTLDTNYRSKIEIVNYNNSLFTRLPVLLEKKFNEDITSFGVENKLKNIISNAYSDVFQKVAEKNKLGGYVRYEFYSKNELSEENDTIHDRFLNLVDELLLSYNPSDLAVLVRRNSEANDIMKLLLDHSANKKEEEQFNVISAESLLLSNSMAVRLLINALKFIEKNDEHIFALEILSDFYRLNNINFDEHKFFDIENKAEIFSKLPTDFSENIQDFKHLTLFELCEKLIHVFKLNEQKTEIPFIRAFEELISNFTAENGSNVYSFIEFWNENSHKHSVQISEIKDSMQVMTIHKAKGLDFKVVIMPFVNWELNPTHNTLIWCSTKNSDFDVFPFLPINVTKDMLNTHFADFYIEEKFYSFMDALNMLYVAFTRPRERLYCFSALPNNITGNNIAEQIYFAFSENQNFPLIYKENELTKLENYFDKDYLVFEIGEDYKSEDDKKSSENLFKIEKYPVNDWKKNIEIVTHDSELIAEMVETRKIAIKQGLLMHEIFSLINTYDDVDDALNKMLVMNKITANEAEKIRIDIEKLFQNPIVKSWFTDEWTVWSEKEILTKSAEIKIPDRVLSNEKEVIVIDYKFGKKRPEHKTQVKNYINLLKDIEQDKLYKAYLLYADNQEVVEVI